ALETAHEQGIIHCDLKPASIKVKPSGVVKVLDFRLAKLAEVPSGTADVTAAPSMSLTITEKEPSVNHETALILPCVVKRRGTGDWRGSQFHHMLCDPAPPQECFVRREGAGGALSRREFLRRTAAGAGAAYLTACGSRAGHGTSHLRVVRQIG